MYIVQKRHVKNENMRTPAPQETIETDLVFKKDAVVVITNILIGQAIPLIPDTIITNVSRRPLLPEMQLLITRNRMPQK